MSNTKSLGLGMRVTPELKAKLMYLASQTGVSMAEAACQAIETTYAGQSGGCAPSASRLDRARALARDAAELARELQLDAQSDLPVMCGCEVSWDENTRLALQLLSVVK